MQQVHREKASLTLEPNMQQHCERKVISHFGFPWYQLISQWC